MIELTVEHHRVFIEALPEDLKKIRKCFRVYKPVFNPPPGMPPFETIDLFYWKTNSFPTGFLSEVVKNIKKEGIEYKINDNRKYVRGKIKFKYKNDEPLWDNQVEAFEAIQKPGNEVGVVSSATGTGKTRLIEETINYVGLKTLVIVPFRAIQKQTYNKFIESFGRGKISLKAPKKTEETEEFKAYESQTYAKVGGSIKDFYSDDTKENVDPGSKYKKIGGSISDLYSSDEDSKTTNKYTKIGGSISDLYASDEKPEDKFKNKKGLEKKGFKNSTFKNKFNNKNIKIIPQKKKVNLGTDITILCFQSLEDVAQEFMDTIECVIIDESHHSGVVSIREALDRMPKAAYRYGFSATPWRDQSSDMKILKSSLGDNIIYELRGEEAVERGIIAKPVYAQITAPTPEEFLQDIKNWRELVDRGIVGNATRNKSIVNKAVDQYENGHNVFICVDEIAHLQILEERLKEKGIDPLIIHGQQSAHINDENIKKIGTSKTPIISIGTMAVGEGTDMPNISVVILAGGGKASIRFLQRIGRGTRLVNGKDELLVIDIEDWFNKILMKHSNMRKKTFQKYFGK